jgi:hypothetical protein
MQRFAWIKRIRSIPVERERGGAGTARSGVGRTHKSYIDSVEMEGPEGKGGESFRGSSPSRVAPLSPHGSCGGTF